MEKGVLGIHHITAIAGDAKRNFRFYTEVLGLRMVKKTVNFDDPGTYHFYYGDAIGTPGTILTFFPWEGIHAGRPGAGMATEIGYAVPDKSFDFWMERFKQHGVKGVVMEERFGESCLLFEDPDGLRLALIVPKQKDERKPWTVGEVNTTVATRGFHNVALTVRNIKPTATVLTDVLGYTLASREGNRFRFMTNAIEHASIVDLIEVPGDSTAAGGSGTVHHVAFRVKDEDVLMHYREKVLTKGLHITPKIDRNYFFSLYFREPGGVLFELATDNPGFAVDESVEALGTQLKLPAQYEVRRAEIEKVLPPLS